MVGPALVWIFGFLRVLFCFVFVLIVKVCCIGLLFICCFVVEFWFCLCFVYLCC